MPRPIKRSEFIRRLRALGWEGPWQRGKHPFMVKGAARLTIPNPHVGDIDWSLVRRILQQAEITPEQWESV